MKKFMLTVFCLLASLALVACGGAKEAEYKLGMGVVMSTKSSTDGTVADDGTKTAGKVQFDGMVAALVTDKDGKIVEVRLDAIQNKGTISEGVFTLGNLKTKRELGNDYHMHDWGAEMDNNGDGKVLEWFEQANAFEAWAKGKTRADIAAMTTKEANGHNISTDEALLAAGCTIEIDEFKNAILLAFDDEQGMTFKANKFTLGVAATSFQDAKTKNAAAATADAEAVEGEAHIYVDFGATVVADGKVIAALNDAIQPVVKFNVEDKITGNVVKLTKRNLKGDYGMEKWGSDNNNDGIVKEWFEQSAAFSNYVLGKTVDDIKNMKTQSMNDHQVAADEELLKAGCTMQITDIIAVVAKAGANAR